MFWKKVIGKILALGRKSLIQMKAIPFQLLLVVPLRDRDYTVFQMLYAKRQFLDYLKRNWLQPLRIRFCRDFGQPKSFRLDGWVYESGGEMPDSIALVIDQTIVGKFKQDQKRPDVRRHFGYAPLRTGFSLDLGEFFCRIRQLQVYALFRNGEARLVPWVRELQFMEHPVAPVSTIVDPDVKKIYQVSERMATGYIDWIRAPLDLNALIRFFRDAGVKFSHFQFAATNFVREVVRPDLPVSQVLDWVGEVHRRQEGGRKVLYAQVHPVLMPSRLESDVLGQVTPIRPTYKLEIREPKVFPHRLRPMPLGTVEVPREEIYLLKNASVVSGSIVITERGERFLCDDAANPANDFVAGESQSVVGLRQVPGQCLVYGIFEERRNLEAGILLTGRCTLNYFHWLIEYLPRFKSVDGRDDFAGWPLLVDERMPKTFKEALQVVVGHQHPIEWINPSVFLQVKKLCIPSYHTRHPDTVKIPFYRGAALSSAHLTYLRNKAYTAMGGPAPATRKIFLSRRHGLARGLLNAQKITEIARAKGFELVDPSELSFLDQVRLFSSARIIAGPSGAAFANTVFCQPGTRIVALLADQLKNFCIFDNLAALSSCEYMMVTGPSEYPWPQYADPYSYMHSNFKVRLADFKRALAHVGA